MARFKVGDMVRSPSGGGYSFTLPLGRVVEVNSQYLSVEVHDSDKPGRVKSKWSYHAGELELVTEGGEVNKPYQRKTYRLLKDLPDTRKGAVFQEACDDGTQPYMLISREHYKGSDSANDVCYTDRSLVEDNPKWFVEVFAVEPEYMTADELAQWDAFKSREKPGRKAGMTVAEVGRATAKKPRSLLTDTEYRVGDRVKVNSTGAQYSTYTDWAHRHGLTKYVEQISISTNSTYKIVAIDYHSRNNSSVLAGLQDAKGNQFIFGLYGSLTRVSKKRGRPVGSKNKRSEAMKASWARRKAAQAA